ncbi:MAG: endo-1,4-beta-xylanase [Polyangiaceae bacterium]|nr:endo-1,4-beta-xylanase [Polyangiaceae bacterium]
MSHLARPAASRRSPARRRAWLAGILWASALVVVPLGACIKRQPLPPVASTADTPAEASALAAGPTEEKAPTEPTGNWGKVPGVAVIGPGGIREFMPHGQVEKVKHSIVEVDGEEFNEAARAIVLRGSANTWDVQLQTRTVNQVEKGDVLLATFSFRVTQAEAGGGDGDTEFVFELGREPYSKSVSYPVRGGRDWKTIRVPFVSANTFKPGEAQAIFRLGYPPQTIEIGGVTLENFGKQLALADLPMTRPSYRGMALDAAWRAAAEARIEKVRKAELKVVVRDQGKVVSGANVHLTLKRHAFAFGTAATAARVLDQSEPKYLETLTELFNTVTLENDLEWRAVAGDSGAGYSAERTRSAIDLLAQRGIPVRGRALVRPAWDAVPRTLEKDAKNPAKLRQAVEGHLRDLLGTYGTSVTTWTVVDSPYDRRDILEVLGDEAMGDWFKLARSLAPKAELVLDTTGALNTGGLPDRQRESAESVLRQLLIAGAPVDAIGVQAQYASKLTAPEEIVATIERLGQQGKPVIVTRFDPLLEDTVLGGDYLRDFYIAVFSSPAAKGITLWGFWDREHWKNRAALYHTDWSTKPAADQYRDLMLKRWHTDVQGQTDAQGTFTARGFLGDYTVEAAVGGRSANGEVSLVAGGATLELKM